MRFGVALLLLVGCPSQDDVTDAVDTTDSGTDSETGTDDGDVDEPTGTTGDVEDDADAGGLDLVCGGGNKLDKPFPAAEIGVRITSPTGQPGYQYPGGTVTLGGVVFGDVATLHWTKGSTTQEIAPVAAFWQTGGIPLDPGDNEITVTAVASDGITATTDSVIITSNPSQASGLQLKITPDHIYVGETQQLKFSLSVPIGEVQADQVNLYLVEDDGTDVSPPDVSKLWDDGGSDEAGHCDAIIGDRVYSGCRTQATTEVGRKCFRVRLQTPGGVIATPSACVDVITRVSVGDCNSMSATLAAAKSAYDSTGIHEPGLDKAEVAAFDSGGSVKVAEVGRAVGDWGIWGRFQNGVVGAVPLGVPKGFRAGEVGSRRATLLHANKVADELAVAADKLGNAETCPPFDLNGPLNGPAANLKALRHLGGSGLIGFSGHGGAYFSDMDKDAVEDYRWRHGGAQEVWWTGESIDCTKLLDHTATCQKTKDCPAGAECVEISSDPGGRQCVSQTQADLQRGRLVLGHETYGVLPSFVSRYSGRLPNSVVYGGACYSLWNGSMAMAFLGAGAGSYVGFNGLVSEEFATEIGSQLFCGVIDDKETVADAMCFASDPEEPSTQAVMAGSSGVNFATQGVLNSDFEDPGLMGWSVDGDVAQVPVFCGAKPVEGTRMALVATGLGFTALSGDITQSFCIPAGAKTMSFSWRYYTAEMPMSCGLSSFQDKWEVSLSKFDGSATEMIRDCTVSDMCRWDEISGGAACLPSPCEPPSTCACGDCYTEENPPLLTDACKFEGQDVTATDWGVQTFNISPWAGAGPVRLTISVENVGTPTLDTAVLIDDLKIQ